jgi:xanthosine utilization system XapX-like protein
MFALIQNTPPSMTLLAIAGLAGLLIGCRAIVACWLGLAVIRASRPKDLPEALAAVPTVLDAAFRLKR